MGNDIELPTGWVFLTLEDVADIHDNLREPVNSVERAKRHGPYPYYGATGQVGWIDDYRQNGEYVLLGEDGAPFFDWLKDKAYLVSGKCWVNNHAHVLKGKEGVCSNRYLLYALNQTDYRGYANGTTRLKLTQSAMRRIPVNLAPPKEQHRIVAKIEELFSELDKGIENLKTAQAQLKVYRQALLKNAFEGKLTAQWRAERHAKQSVAPAKAGAQPLNDMDSRLPPAFARVTGNDEVGDGNDNPLETADTLLKRIQQERAQRYQQQLADWEKSPSIPLCKRGRPTSSAPIPPLEKGGRGGISKPKPPKSLPPLTAEELAELPELPEGWGWVKLEAIVEEGPINGYSPQAVKFETGTKAITLTATTSGKFDGSYFKYIDEAIPNESSLWLRFGDILIQRGNTIEYVGVPAIYKGHASQFIYPDLIMKIRVVQFVDADYTVFSLREERARSWLRRRAVGAAGSMPKINHSTLRSLPIPICSNLEQQQIVQELEAKLSEVDQLEQTITTALQQAEALRQSILKKAFSGQLVPQDPNDESASELLARIRVEKAASSKVKGKQRSARKEAS